MTDQTEKINGLNLRIEVERLDGGYISNVLNNKRRIFKNALDIDDAIDIKTALGKVEDGEYVIKVDIIPKDEYKCTPDDILNQVKDTSIVEQDILGLKNLPIYEQAKLDGTIQPADKFDPEPAKPVIDTTKPITVTGATCYSINQLRAIPWSKYDKEYPLTTREKSEISGIVGSTMYNLWIKVEAGTFQWQSINTKIGMTILAKYYERMADKKVRKDDGIPPRNDKRLMEVVSEIELLCKGGLIKPNVLMKKVEQFKKLLIQD